MIDNDPCPYDTNGDGNCGRTTCARCHPEYQPLQGFPAHIGGRTVAEYVYDPRCACYLCMSQHWSRRP